MSTCCCHDHRHGHMHEYMENCSHTGGPSGEYVFPYVWVPFWEHECCCESPPHQHQHQHQHDEEEETVVQLEVNPEKPSAEAKVGGSLTVTPKLEYVGLDAQKPGVLTVEAVLSPDAQIVHTFKKITASFMSLELASLEPGTLVSMSGKNVIARIRWVERTRERKER